MKIIKFLFLICSNFFLFTISAQVNPVKLPNNAFISGEVIKYDLKYTFYTGGEASLSLTNSAIDGKPVYHAVLLGRSRGLLDKIFSVRDQYESYFNPETGLPVLAIRNIKEQKYRYYEETRFYHSQNKVVSSKKGEYKTPDNIHDIVSVFYYLRRLDFSNFKGGEIIRFNTFFSDTIFPFDIKFKGREVLNTEYGKIRCLKFVPSVEPGRVFKTKEDMTFWFTDDSNLLPVRIKLNLFIGSLVADLTEYSNLKNKITIVK